MHFLPVFLISGQVPSLVGAGPAALNKLRLLQLPARASAGSRTMPTSRRKAACERAPTPI